jgi:hypothetical protein
MKGIPKVSEQFLHTQDVPAFLREHVGIKISVSTVYKRFMPSSGEGPKPAGYWSGRPVYRPSDVLDWAISRIRPTRKSA